MNHLAHFFLSDNKEDIMIGNFIADFITNKELPLFTEGVQQGIMLHREIDAFTDSHPVVKQSTKRLHPFHHKYAPVIVDIYYDFLLAKNWSTYAPHLTLSWRNAPLGEPVKMADFIENIYQLLKKRNNELPEKLQKRLPYMIKNNWLMTYTTLAGLNDTFERVERQAAFPGNFGNATHHLEMYMEEFDEEFNNFFPDLIARSKKIITI
jgi:acyl carrier protein phosphodiesterase